MSAAADSDGSYIDEVDLYRTVADFTYDWEYWLDPQGRLLYCSPACERITGYPPEEFLGDPGLLTAIVHPDDVDLVGHHAADVSLLPESAELEFRILARCGEVRWIGHACRSVHRRNGTFRGRRVTNRDITRRKRAEQSLHESESLLRTIADNYPNSYLSIIEKDLSVGFTAGQAFRKHSLDPAQYVGLLLEQVFGEHTPLVREHYLRTFAGEEQTFELYINEQHQMYRTVPLHAADGTIPRILAVVEDATERRQAQLDLETAHEDLKRKVDELERFNRVTRDRELRMIELKREVNALLRQAGQPEKYRIVE